MNRQQFTGWVARLLDALPWRKARRPSRTRMQARVTSPSKADRFAFPDDSALKRQKIETNPLCSTLHEDVPATQAPPPPPQPLLMPPASASEAASAPLLALPPPPAASAAEAAEPSDEPPPFQADPERRLGFARYLYRRGVFNEGFTRDSLPAQYRDRTSQE